MSNRKLQKYVFSGWPFRAQNFLTISKLTQSREVEAVFKKIHEGLDLFNYYFSRHEASNNDSQREKLESDLKKEIKKLQKFRDQIKNWQGNDSLEATIASLKLQEHRRLVEEAMECYKEVEKNSKMKSFSNQSIMLASLDNGNDLSPEVQEAYEFLTIVVETLTEQNEGLEEEYEKISQKKVRKNNLLAIEERKQELENFRLRNEFHIEKIEAVMNFLRTKKVSAERVLEIQEDLNFYMESNQDPDFVDDETVYDEIIKEARENHENNTQVINETDVTPDLNMAIEDETVGEKPPAAQATITNDQVANGIAKPRTKTVSPGLPQSHPSSDNAAKAAITPKGKQFKTSTGEAPSPAFITTLKPAVTPSKPVAPLKWSLAAAGAAPSSTSPASSPLASLEKELTTKLEKASQNSKLEPAPENTKSESVPLELQTSRNDNDALSELLSLLTKTEEFAPYVEVLKQSNLTPREFEVLADTELLKAPIGIQDYSLRCVAANRLENSGALLRKSILYEPFVKILSKPYLPSDNFQYGIGLLRPPLFLGKLQNYWNRVRASNQYDQFLQELESLEAQSAPENTVMVNELTMVLFYGCYYGVLPLENIIAESMLHKLGWRPYDFRSGAGTAASADAKFGQFQTWIKKLDGQPLKMETGSEPDAGDFRVFDLSSWEIYAKYAYSFDSRLCQPSPTKCLT